MSFINSGLGVESVERTCLPVLMERGEACLGTSIRWSLCRLTGLWGHVADPPFLWP